MIRTGLMEKIMSKTRDTSDFGRATLEDHGTLADSELEAVAGGFGGGFCTSFLAMTTVGAHTEATWTPRTYAVQTDLSGSITGARASLYGWRRP
jgi:hypothetical protein